MSKKVIHVVLAICLVLIFSAVGYLIYLNKRQGSPLFCPKGESKRLIGGSYRCYPDDARAVPLNP